MRNQCAFTMKGRVFLGLSLLCANAFRPGIYDSVSGCQARALVGCCLAFCMLAGCAAGGAGVDGSVCRALIAPVPGSYFGRTR